MKVEPRRIARVPHRAVSGVFHDYVRAVFAEHSVHSRGLRARRARWLQRLAERPVPGARPLSARA